MDCLRFIIVGKEPVVITLFETLSKNKTTKNRPHGVVSPNSVDVDIASKYTIR